MVAGQRLVVGVDCGLVLTIGIQAQSQKLISLSIAGIDAERGARLGNCVGAVVHAIKKISQGAVVLGKIGHELRGLGEFVECVVPFLLLAESHAEGEVQGRILASAAGVPEIGIADA